MTLEGRNTAVEQRPGNLGVPLGDNDTEYHVGGVRDFLQIVFRQILGSH